MKVSEILKAAKAKIDTPDKWCQKELCNGEDYCNATRFCSIGALWSIEEEPDAETYLRRAARARKFDGIIHLNDNENTTHADVMAAYDEAIELAEKDEKNG